MNAPLIRAFVLVVALFATAGCGVNGALGYDPYASAYGSGYGSDYGSSPGSSYGSDYGSSYGSSYGTDYGSSYGSGYGSSTGGGPYGGASASPAPTSGTYGDYGSSYGDDAVVRANASTRPDVTPPPAAPSTLSAWVVEVKEPSFFARLRGARITAKVEVENPSDRTLTGRVRVRFLDSGNPTGVIQTRRVSLAPKEKQVLTFSADAGRLDDAEASVETEGAAVGRGVVADRPSASGQ